MSGFSRGFLVFGVLLVAVASQARAETPTDEADALIRKGIELRKVHADEAALPVFQKAYDLAKTPRAAAQLGLDEQALGRWEFAEQHVQEALLASSDSWVVKNRGILDAAMVVIGEHIGRIEVIGEPIGAEVWVNGRASGRLPLADPIHVSAGEVDVELRAAGYASTQRTLNIVGGQYQRVVLRLAKANAPTANADAPSKIETGAASTTVGVAPLGGTPAAGEGVASSTSSLSPPISPYLAAKWGAAGLGGAALVVGVVASVVHEKRSTDFANHGTCSDKNGTAVHDADGSLAPECQSDLNAYHTARTWQIAGFVGAGVLGATWLALTLFEPHPAQTVQATRCSPSFSTTSLAWTLSCQTHF